MTPGRTPRAAGLAPRLFAAQLLIVLTGAITMVLVVVAVAPGLFRGHTHQMMGPMSGEMAQDLDEALATTLLISLPIAVGAASLTSLAVSWLITRRLTRPIGQMATAAARVAAGDYGARVPASRLGAEFDHLDTAFNRMAGTLEHTEQRRQELLADLAHELRTPVATLDSYLEGVEDGVLPASSETWQTMRDQTSRLRRLIEDVGTVSRAEERRLDLPSTPVDLAELAAEAIRAAEPSFRDEDVALTLHRSGSPPRIGGDRDRLREVLDNLLANALRHTPPGGHVAVHVTGHRSGEVELTVSDDGEGIPTEHLPHVFDRFYRTDPARSRATGGSGIGLTIARALVQAHGGTIRADSAGTGCGARFTITLPAAPAARGETVTDA